MKEKLKTAATLVVSWLPDALMVTGAASISAGAGMVYVPAGWIVAGGFALAAGWMLSRGAE